jgi:integrase
MLHKVKDIDYISEMMVDRANFGSSLVAFIEEIPVGAIRWIKEVPGLGIRKKRHGFSWVAKYRINGIQIMNVLGDKELALPEARALYKRAKSSAKLGVDLRPPREKKGGLSPLFSTFAARYLEEHSTPNKRSWKEDERRINKVLIPLFGSKRLEQITRANIYELKAAVAKRGTYESNRCVELMNSIFRMARQWEVYPEVGKLPTEGVGLFKEFPRERWINESEMERFAKAVNSENLEMKTILWLYLLTGLRRRELLSLEWAQVDLKAGVIQLSAKDTKAKRAHYLPLPQQAVALLSQLEKKGTYVFPGIKPGTHRKCILHAWQRVRKVSELEDVCIHDLRRTTATWLARSGNSLSIIGRALNQSTQHVTSRYAQFADSDLKDAMSMLGSMLSNYIAS